MKKYNKVFELESKMRKRNNAMLNKIAICAGVFDLFALGFLASRCDWHLPFFLILGVAVAFLLSDFFESKY